jgi:FAD/FMN-containing dehydrogenase
VGSLDRRDFLAGAGVGGIALVAPGDLIAAIAELFDVEPALSPRSFRALRRDVRGPVLLPKTPGYGRARLVFNSRFDGRLPAAVVQPRDTRDVRAVVRWADRFDARLVPRSGGHSYAGYSAGARAVVVDLRRIRGIRVNAGGKRATVSAGARLIDLYATLAHRGMTVPAGTCPTVGVGGLALGGGFGLASRRFGLTSDNLRALTIVTADGKIRRADRDTDEDLFWASRGGGGGNFGIATGFEFRAHRARGAAHFFVSWPWARASAAIAAWQKLAPHAPDGLTSVLSLGTGGPRVSASGQFFGPAAQLRRLLRPLTRIDGASLTVGESSYLALMLRWAGGSRTSPRSSFHAASAYVAKPLSSLARARMIDWIERRQRTPSLGSGALLLDAYGGAINRVRPEATAFVHRDQLFSIQFLAYFNGAAAGRASKRWVADVHSALRPFASGQAYQNYIDADLVHWQRAYYGDNLPRLREVKKAYDPDFRFRFRQAIPPAR